MIGDEVPYMPLHNFDLLNEMLHMGIKKDHPNKYQKPGDTNCRFCRKKCKLFGKNECYKKTPEEQMKCEFYKENR